MKTLKYDILILGGGPIGSSAAYFLSQKNLNKKIALIRAEPLEEDNYHLATYLYAGGCVRNYFDDQEMREMTTLTIDFIRNLNKKGVDLSLIEDYYCFLNRGVMVPSVNISGSKLVSYFLNEAQAKNVEIFNETLIKNIVKNEEVVIETNKGNFTGEKILLALGHSINKFLPEANFAFKKRQLFVLDLELKEEQKNFPHLIAPLSDGLIYIFVKLIDGKYKFVLGQEDIFEEDNKFEGKNYFEELKKLGLFSVLPFLKEAKVEKILWGFDAENKKLKIYQKDNLITACCGSAVRSCFYIGQKLADLLS